MLMVNKKFVTSKENKKGKNIKSVNRLTDKERYNKNLIKKCKNNNLPWYHVVNSWKKNEYLRSNPDNKKKNNLDPKRKPKK